jgi:hypothetical protein
MRQLVIPAVVVVAVCALAGCDFDGAYERCVQEGRCVQPGVPVRLAFLSAAQVQHVGGCSAPVMVQALDLLDEAARPGDGVLLQIAAPAGGLELFSDSFCETKATEVPFDQAATATFYFAGLTPGTHRLEVSATGLPALSQDARVLATGIASIAFTSVPSQLVAGSCSPPLQLEQRGASGAPASAPASLRYILTSDTKEGVTFHADPQCLEETKDVFIPAGETAAVLRIRPLTAGDVEIRAEGIAILPATATVKVDPAAASRIAFATPPRQVDSRQCSEEVRVTAQDAFGNPAAVTAPVQVNLASAPAGLTFHPVGACGGVTLTSVIIAPGAATASFSFSGAGAGMYQLTATAGALGTAQQAASVGPGAASSLAFATAPRTLVAGACSPPLTVELRDDSGNLATAAGGLQISLSAGGTPGVTFFSDSQCQSPASSVHVPPGGSNATFHVVATRAGALSLGASAAPLQPATQVQQVSAGPATALAFTTPSRTPIAGGCSGLVTLELRDAFGNAAVATASLPVTLTSSASGVEFYTDEMCLSRGSMVTFQAGASQARLSFGGTTAGPLTLTASAGGLAPASQGHVINPGPPQRLRIVSAEQTVGAGECSAPVRVQLRDAYDNPAVATTDLTLDVSVEPEGEATIHAMPDCKDAAVTSLPFRTGAAEVSFHFTATLPQTITLALAAGSLGADWQNATIVPGPVAELRYVTPPYTVLAGACSPPVRMATLDAHGNVNTTPTQVSFTASPMTVFADPACQVPVTSAQSQGGLVQVHFSGEQGGLFTLRAAVAGSPSFNQTEGISPVVRAVACGAPNGNELSCTFSPPVLDRGRAFAVLQVSSTAPDPAHAMFACQLADASTVICRRHGGGGAFTISGYVVEHRNAKVLHVGEISCLMSGTSSRQEQQVPLGGIVEMDRSFVLAGASSGDSQVDGNDTIQATLTRPDTVTLSSSGGCAPGMRFQIQVVELQGASVTRGTVPGMVGTSIGVVGLPAVDLSRTLVLSSWRARSGTVNGICARAIESAMPSASTLVFTRGDGNATCGMDAVDEIAWERIELPAGSRVQTASIKMPVGVLSVIQGLATVDLTRSFALSSGMSFAGVGTGQGSLSTDDVIGEVMARHTLGSPSQLVLGRVASSGSASWTSSVVELKP